MWVMSQVVLVDTYFPTSEMQRQHIKEGRQERDELSNAKTHNRSKPGQDRSDPDQSDAKHPKGDEYQYGEHKPDKTQRTKYLSYLLFQMLKQPRTIGYDLVALKND